MWWSIGGGIIIFALGMFIFLKPGLIWKLTEEWKSYRADEPSAYSARTAHPFRRNGAPFRFKLSKAQLVD